MKQFFAAKNVAYGASKSDATLNTALSPETLAEGAIAIYAKHGTTGKLTLVDAVADLLDVKEVFIARGLAVGSIVSDAIERKTLKVEKTAAVTAVGKVVSITFPATLPAGTPVEVAVINNNSLVQTDWRAYKRYTYKTIAANESSETISNAIGAKIALDTKTGVLGDVATADTLKITLSDVTKNFAVQVLDGNTGNFIGATITTSTALVKPIGTPTGMKMLQLDAEAYQGRVNYIDRTTGPMGDSNQVTEGITYTTYNLGWTGTTVRLAVPTDPVASRFKRIVLAIPTGSAAIATLDAILIGVTEEEVAAQAEEVGA